MNVTKTSTSSELTVAHELQAAPQEHPTVFQARFSRCYRLLHFIACRVLGGPERSDEAVDNCWLRASRNPSHFIYEGAFRSWLVRVLIDEALAIRREHQETVKPKVSCERRRTAHKKEKQNMLRINDEAPNFTAETSQGTINFE